MMFPLINFDQIELGEANAMLAQWEHRMGPLRRANFATPVAHALFHNGRPVAIAVAAGLIRENVAGRPDLNRGNTIELARLCAERTGLCRVVLRLWREFVLPELPAQVAISYQDADLHSGATYRFDGWRRIGYSHSGTDRRSGRRGRNKWIWAWPPSTADAASTECR